MTNHDPYPNRCTFDGFLMPGVRCVLAVGHEGGHNPGGLTRRDDMNVLLQMYDAGIIPSNEKLEYLVLDRVHRRVYTPRTDVYTVPDDWNLT